MKNKTRKIIEFLLDLLCQSDTLGKIIGGPWGLALRAMDIVFEWARRQLKKNPKWLRTVPETVLKLEKYDYFKDRPFGDAPWVKYMDREKTWAREFEKIKKDWKKRWQSRNGQSN